MADTSELLHTIVEATNILFNLQQESVPGSKLNARERATIKDVRIRLDSLKSRLQAEAQAPAVLTKIAVHREVVAAIQSFTAGVNIFEAANEAASCILALFTPSPSPEQRGET